MSTHSESTTSPPARESARAVKRRKPNVTRACARCRHRRTRCDGQPRCSACVQSNEECIYTPDQDGRKPASKAYVAALLNRVQHLEQLLNSRGKTPEAESSSGSSAVVQVAGNLRVEDDVLTHHGPTSAYMHLPDSPTFSKRLKPASSPFEAEEGEPDSTTDLEHLQWDRHLPPGAIGSYRLHRELLSVFFSYIAAWCYWTDEASFNKGLGQSVQAPQPYQGNINYSPMLHNVILALAVQLAPPHILDESLKQEMFDCLGRKALELINVEGLRPTVGFVKGLMFLGTYHWAIGRHSMGWAYEGMGVRFAQTLGLNTDCDSLVSRKILTPHEKELRDRCLWTVYIQDQLWGLAVGRTPGLTAEDIEVPIPEIDPEVDALPCLSPGQDASQAGPSASSQPAWTSSVFHYTCRLASLADRMHQALYRIRPAHVENTQTLVSKLHLELNQWLIDLPGPLRIEGKRPFTPPPNVINMHVVFRYLQILLHRPTYTRPHSTHDERLSLAAEACKTAATEINSLLQMYATSPGLRYATTTITNATFTAGTIHLLTATQSTSDAGAQKQAMNLTRECLSSLKAMSWPAARSAGDILHGLVVEWAVDRSPGSSSTGSGEKEEEVDTSLIGDVAMKDLKDPNSEVGQLLTKVGWQPPPKVEPPAPTEGPNGDMLDYFGLSAYLKDFMEPIDQW